MYLLFVKGDRGLVASYNGIMCFPDKHGSIKEPGLYACEITSEHSHYYFMDGTRITTGIPTDSDIYALETNLDEVRDIQVIKSGEDYFLLSTYRDGTFSLFAKDAKQISYIPIILEAYVHGPGRSHVGYLYNQTLEKEVVRDTIDILYALMDKYTVVFDNEEDMMKALVAIYCSIVSKFRYSVENISVYQKKHFVVTYERFGAYEKAGFNIVRIEDVLSIFPNSLRSQTLEPYDPEDYSASTIRDYMVEHNIGLAAPDSDDLIYHVLKISDEFIDVYYLNGSHALRGYTDTVIKKAQESMDAFREYGKRILKNPTKQTLKLAKSLTPQAALNLVDAISYTI